MQSRKVVANWIRGGGGGGGGGVTFAYGLNSPKMERGLIDVGKIDYKWEVCEVKVYF